MDRRGFLGAILATGAAPAVVRAASLMPVFARVESGLLVPEVAESGLLTIDMIVRECLRLAHEKSSFISTINRQFDHSFQSADRIVIRMPQRFVVAA